MVKKETNNVWGVTSLVTGILSLVLFLMPYFGLPLGIFAIISYSLQRKNGTNGISRAGLVLGILGTVLNAVVGLIALIFIAAFAGGI